jgi:hypothetical protein
MIERRATERVSLAENLEGTLGGMAVRLVEVSTTGARLEHLERATVNSTLSLRFSWGGERVAIPSRVTRSEISSRRGSSLLYHSGVEFTAVDEAALATLAALVEANRPEVDTDPDRAIDRDDTLPKPPPDPDATHRRAPSFFSIDDADAAMPFAQYRLSERGWTKDYVASPEQPADGFTIAREDHDELPALQRTYESADDETRHMMRIALQSQLEARQGTARPG